MPPSTCAFVGLPVASRSSFVRAQPICLPLPRATLARRPRRAAAAATALLDNLTENLTSALSSLRRADKLTPKNTAAALKRVRRSLLEADVALPVVKELLASLQSRLDTITPIPNVSPGDLFVRAVYSELVLLMGGDPEVDPTAPTEPPPPPVATAISPSSPAVILLAGLQGAGKTTAAAKLARYLAEKESRKVLLVAADVYRPAAVDQLHTVGAQVGAEVFSMPLEPERPDPADIARAGVAKAVDSGCDTVIVDTAGRQVIDGEMMDELVRVKKAVNAGETLLVVDAMTGQEAARLTKAFDETVPLTGAILTKMDGDTRGGSALSVRKVSGKPIKFVGVGEKLDKLEVFYPERMASRILGMGDVLSLVEKAQESFSDQEAEKMTQKMMDATFNFEDFRKQSRMMNSMGSLAGLAKMIPGVGKIDQSKLDTAEQRLKVADSLINSMTKQERRDPDLLLKDKTSTSRLQRIANGSGRTLSDAKGFLVEFKRMRTMMQNMSRNMGGGAQGVPTGPGGGVDMGRMANRATRRRQAKKKAEKGGPSRGFGRK